MAIKDGQPQWRCQSKCPFRGNNTVVNVAMIDDQPQSGIRGDVKIVKVSFPLGEITKWKIWQ